MHTYTQTRNLFWCFTRGEVQKTPFICSFILSLSFFPSFCLSSSLSLFRHPTTLVPQRLSAFRLPPSACCLATQQNFTPLHTYQWMDMLLSLLLFLPLSFCLLLLSLSLFLNSDQPPPPCHPYNLHINGVEWHSNYINYLQMLYMKNKKEALITIFIWGNRTCLCFSDPYPCCWPLSFLVLTTAHSYLHNIKDFSRRKNTLPTIPQQGAISIRIPSDSQQLNSVKWPTEPNCCATCSISKAHSFNWLQVRASSHGLKSFGIPEWVSVVKATGFIRYIYSTCWHTFLSFFQINTGI